MNSQKITIKDLQQQAKDLGIKSITSYKKQDLQDKINEILQSRSSQIVQQIEELPIIVQEIIPQIEELPIIVQQIIQIKTQDQAIQCELLSDKIASQSIQYIRKYQDFSMIDLHQLSYLKLDQMIYDIQDIMIHNNLLLIQSDSKWFNISDIKLFDLYEYTNQFHADNRLILNNKQFINERVSYNDYPNKQQTDFNSMNKTKLSQVYSKLTNENKINIVKQSLQIVYFDIETSNYKNKHQVPTVFDLNSEICIIQLLFKQEITVYITHDYLYDIQLIQNKFKDFQVTIIYCQSEQQACISFIEKLNDISQYNKTILMGFNSSQGKLDKNITGYDLPFILKRSRIPHKVNSESSQYFFGNEFNTYFVDRMPNVIMIDAKNVFYKHFENNKKVVNGYKLDDFISIIIDENDIDHQKLDIDYLQLQQQLLTESYDQTNNIIYAIQDVVILQYAIDTKIKFIHSLEISLQIQKLPITFYISNNATTSTKYQLQQQFHQNNYIFTYDYIPESIYSQSKFYQYRKLGGYTYMCSNNTLKVYKSVADCDFSAFYPSTCCHNNISPEIITDDIDKFTNKYTIDIAFQQELPNGISKKQLSNNKKKPIITDNIIYINSDQLGIIPQYFIKLLKDKAKFKKEKETYIKGSIEYQIIESKEKEVKLLLNSAYGALGQESFGLYNFQAFQAITSCCRIALHQAMKIAQNEFGIDCIISVDTDGFQVISTNGKLITYESIKVLIEKINAEFSQSKGVLTITLKDIIDTFLSNNSKQYLFRSHKDNKIEFRGASTSNFTKQYKNQIDQLFKDILCEKVTYQEGMYTLEQKIYETFKNAQCIDDIQQYSYTVKSSKKISTRYIKQNDIIINTIHKETTMGYLYNNYQQKSTYNVFAFNNDQQSIMYQIKPIQNICRSEIRKINIQQTMCKLLNNLKSFFNIIKTDKLTNYMGIEQDINSYKVPLRIQTTKTQKKAQYVNPEDVESFVLNNQYQSIHEVITNKCKLIFDIDMEITNNEQPLDINQFVNNVKYVINKLPLYHVATAHKYQNNQIIKYSYHIVFNSVYDLQIQKQIATILHKTYKYIDLSIYTENHTIRLPLCIKIKDNLTEDRKFIFDKQLSNYTDFLVNNYTDDMIHIVDNIAYSNDFPINDIAYSLYDIQNQNQITQYMKDKYQIDCEFIDNKQNKIKIHNDTYFCPIHQRQHESHKTMSIQQKQKELTLYCFAIQKEVKQPRTIVLNVSENVIKQTIIHPIKQFKNALIQNQEKVHYNIDNCKVSFIKSHMGTAKTESLINQLDIKIEQNPNLKVLAISFRRTFASDFASKFKFINYKDLVDNNEQISFNNHSQICVQIDSLYKINLEEHNIDILILDELESIYSQIIAFDQKQVSTVNKQSLLRLISSSNKTVILDALLQQQTIDSVLKLTQITSYQIIHNQYQPKSDHQLTMKLVGNNEDSVQQFQNEVIQNLKLNKNIVSCISCATTANNLYKWANSNNIKVIIYTGQDVKYYKTSTNEEILKMKDIKKIDFKDVNSIWNQCQLLISTSTLSAGVSFSNKHFNMSINMLHHNTVEAQSFIQSMHRVRDISDKQVIVYKQIDNQFGICKPVERTQESNIIVNKLQNIDQISQFNTFLHCRLQSLKQHSEQLLITWLQSMGYNITIVDQRKKNKQTLTNEIIIDNSNDPLIPNMSEQDFNDIINNHNNEKWIDQNTDQQLHYKLKTVMLMKFYNYNYQLYSQLNSNDLIGLNGFKNREARQRQKLIYKVQQRFRNNEILESEKDITQFLQQFSQSQQNVIANHNVVVHSNYKCFEQIIKSVKLYNQINDILSLDKPLQQDKIIEIIGQKHKYTSIINKQLEHIGYQLNAKRGNSYYTFTLDKEVLNFININE